MISVLAILLVVGMAFFSLSQIERAASLRYLDSVRARYIAESGVVYAEQILKLDKQQNIIDSTGDLTFTHFQGQEIDLDNDGKPDSRWIDLKDGQGKLFGRFSVQIADEASKVNINTCGREILERLFSKVKIDRSEVGILLARRPLGAIEQLGSMMEENDFDLAKDFLTIYSADPEINLKKERRVYLNSAYLNVLLGAFLKRGIKDAYQKAVNLKDAHDSDLAQTVLDKFYLDNITPVALLEPGSWQKFGNYYQAMAGTDAGKFSFSNLPIADGEYFCFLYGPEDTDTVGEAYLDKEELKELVLSGEGLSEQVQVNAGAFTLNIKPVNDKISRFYSVELISLMPKEGLRRETFTGTEALMINELMVKPAREILIDPVKVDPGASFQYTFNQINPGHYYAVVLAQAQGGLVGDISVNGRFAERDLSDGDYFSQTIEVDENGLMIISIKNNSLRESSFKGIRLFQQPDAEFIEVLNLSPQEIDLSNCSFEIYLPLAESVPSWIATIPLGTRIKPYQHLVFAVDNSDSIPSPRQIRNNEICFRNIWNFDVVGLIFNEEQNIDQAFDFLPDNGAKVVFKNSSGEAIDSVEYYFAQVKEFSSLERQDPTAKISTKSNGVYDGWYLSGAEEKATPGLANDNPGMYTIDLGTTRLIKHSPSELVVFNSPLFNLSQVIRLSCGENWKKYSLADIARMADHFSCEATNLPLTGHFQGGEFRERNDIFVSLHKLESGIWEFSQLVPGTYLLSIVGENPQALGVLIQVGIKTLAAQDFTNFSQIQLTQGIACYGIVSLAENPTTLQLKVINDSEQEVAIKALLLEPVSVVSGRINVNTAPFEVLSSLFDSDDLADTVLKNRPFGVKDYRRLGVGELMLIDSKFASFHDLLTTHSDTYEIFSRGEYRPSSKTQAFQNIRTVITRE